MTVDPSGRPTLDREAAKLLAFDARAHGYFETASTLGAYEAALAAETERADWAERRVGELQAQLAEVKRWFENRPWTGSPDGSSHGCGHYTTDELALGYGSYRDPRFLPSALAASVSEAGPSVAGEPETTVTCQRCGSERHGGDVDYSGCRDCREPSEVAGEPRTEQT